MCQLRSGRHVSPDADLRSAASASAERRCRTSQQPCGALRQRALAPGVLLTIFARADNLDSCSACFSPRRWHCSWDVRPAGGPRLQELAIPPPKRSSAACATAGGGARTSAPAIASACDGARAIRAAPCDGVPAIPGVPCDGVPAIRVVRDRARRGGLRRRAGLHGSRARAALRPRRRMVAPRRSAGRVLRDRIRREGVSAASAAPPPVIGRVPAHAQGGPSTSSGIGASAGTASAASAASPVPAHAVSTPSSSELTMADWVEVYENVNGQCARVTLSHASPCGGRPPRSPDTPPRTAWRPFRRWRGPATCTTPRGPPSSRPRPSHPAPTRAGAACPRRSSRGPPRQRPRSRTCAASCDSSGFAEVAGRHEDSK